MIPWCVIKFYDAADVLWYTLTNQALSTITHMGLNDDVGFFTIQLPTASGLPVTYSYTDIARNWTVKVWYGYGTVSTAGNPDFMGKVYQASTVNPQNGYVRTISGKGNSEILQRRIKSRRVWKTTDASVIATELADDLSIHDAAKIVADTTDVNLTVDAESYLDVLKRLSDYWYSAGTQVKKDFYVDVENELVWTTRPIRTVGVETLTMGQNILDYNIIRDGTQIKNYITVYGRKVPYVGLNNATNKFQIYQIFGRKDPSDGDSYTHGAGWVDVKGVTSSQTATPDPAVGANYTQSDSDDDEKCEFYRMFTDPVSCEGYAGYSALEFWGTRYAMLTATIRLYCPDSSNYYATTCTLSALDNTWDLHRFSLGMANVYDATSNPNGQWTATGNPDWENISGIYFYAIGSAPDCYMALDGLCFNFGRWRYTTSNPTSISDYGQNDLVVIDDLLNSDAECESRSKTLLYQQKDTVTRLDVVVTGNNNILIGDQLSMTIPAENISAQNFYVTSVEHYFSKEGFITQATMVDTVNTRNIPAASEKDVILKELNRQREIGKGRLNKVS